MADQATKDSYQYRFAGGVFNSFVFTTIDNIVYEIKFVPSSDFFDAYTDLDVEVFEMVISVVEKPMPGRLPADARTAPTILAIFEDFYIPHRQALIFICDSADGREQARFRKFGLWFYNATRQSAGLSKIDRVIIDGDTLILLSLILSTRHPHRKLLVEIFMELGEEGK